MMLCAAWPPGMGRPAAHPRPPGQELNCFKEVTAEQASRSASGAVATLARIQTAGAAGTARAPAGSPAALPHVCSLSFAARVHLCHTAQQPLLCSCPPIQVVIHSLADAHEEVDKAISAAIFHSKPVYICVCCNLAGALAMREMERGGGGRAGLGGACSEAGLRRAVCTRWQQPLQHQQLATWPAPSLCTAKEQGNSRSTAPFLPAGLHHPSFDSSPIPYSLYTKQSNPRSLEVSRA